MKKLPLLFLLSIIFVGSAFAQQRYIDDVFTDVKVTSGVRYCYNIGVLTGAPALDTTLKVDIYEPMGDTETERPLVLVAPTGNFLPPIFNGGPFGQRTDSANVELCKMLARKGYVAASFTYRLGWNPLPTATDDQRRSTLLQAAYRGIQDAKTLIRWFRKSYAEEGNPYGIDSANVVMGGIGTGGYVSLGAAYLDKQSELFILKFINQQTGFPYVIPAIFGNFEGSDTTYLPITDSTGQVVDSVMFNIGNYPGYSSEFQMAFHMGGALGDSSWIEEGDMPVVSFHSPQDSFAPYNVGNVIVPTTGDIVIPDAAGGFNVQGKAAAFNNHRTWVEAGFNDPYSTAANADNGGKEGFFPVIVPGPGPDVQCDADGAPTPGGAFSGPWNWYNEAWYIGVWDFLGGQPGSPLTGSEANCVALQGTENDPVKARTYLDTVANYLAPRMVVHMDLYPTSIEDDLLNNAITVFPNPALNAVTIRNDDIANSLSVVRLMDMTGKVVQQYNGINTPELTLSRNDLPSGVYILQIQARKGMTTRKVVFE